MGRQSYCRFAGISAALYLVIIQARPQVSQQLADLAEEVQQLLDGAMVSDQIIYTIDDLWALNIEVLQMLEHSHELNEPEILVARNCMAALAEVAHLVPRPPGGGKMNKFTNQNHRLELLARAA